MVSTDTKAEMEEYLGLVPSWIDALPEPAADHSWRIIRDLELGETELEQREKALIGLGAAAALQCPYCVRFHKAEAELEEATDEQLSEAVGIASGVRYFSTVLHGAEIDHDEFAAETADIVDHVRNQQAAPSDDD
ncbi:carboxymuconolactone decarboxylase family protein [Natrinema salinisoli]|uniref:carboxymuconolactone decarboxylase family protein n=1 Tax=Natrinema salinisoli TaxID=2878535 RepID=UPI001CF00ACB|nr:carboxymuconolactone decarboxylase family protein [Natrinema salinisoli]